MLETIVHDLTQIDNWIALLTLIVMELVLGIDNIIFVTILVAKAPREYQNRTRKLGIFLALFSRLALLLSLSWVMGLTEPLITLLGREFSGRDLILCFGGAFLVFKATYEIHDKLEAGPDESEEAAKPSSSEVRSKLAWLVLQIVVLDIVFSLDSVITAVGMVKDLWIMITAMIVSVILMLFSSGPIGRFVQRHPSLKILALSFLLLIGVMLVIEATGVHVSKAYIYVAMAFSFSVEMLNIRYRKKTSPSHRPVRLKEPPLKD